MRFGDGAWQELEPEHIPDLAQLEAYGAELVERLFGNLLSRSRPGILRWAPVTPWRTSVSHRCETVSPGPWRHDSPLLSCCRAAQKAAPGLVIPLNKQLRHLGFRGVVVHVQTFGLKLM